MSSTFGTPTYEGGGNAAPDTQQATNGAAHPSDAPQDVATFLSKDGSTKVSTILARLKKPDGTPWVEKGRKYSPKEWIELLVKALAGEPEVGVETIWEWSCQGCGEEAKKKGEKYPKSVKGMNKFPYDAQKKVFVPEMRCQVNPAQHGYSRARATIARFLSVGELK